jgi:hypothetical protein
MIPSLSHSGSAASQPLADKTDIASASSKTLTLLIAEVT